MLLFGCAAEKEKDHALLSRVIGTEWDVFETMFMSAGESYEDGRYDEAYREFLELNKITVTPTVFYWLGRVETARGNHDAAFQWYSYAALIGEENALKVFNGLDAPAVRSVVFGRPIDNGNLMCELLLDSVETLPTAILVTLRAQHRYPKSTIPFSINSAFDPEGGEVWLYDLAHRNFVYTLRPNIGHSFSILMPSKTRELHVGSTCDNQSTIATVSLSDARIKQALVFEGWEELMPVQQANRVPLRKSGGVYEVPVTINNSLHIHFILDSGAAEVFISPDVATTLLRTGTLGPEDVLPSRTYRLADGSLTESRRFMIKELKIGDRIIKNVECSVAENQSAPMLLGQSALEKLGDYSIDYTNQVLIFN